MGYDGIWYEPIMPTPEEQEMMDAARARISGKNAINETSTGESEFSWRGFAISLAVLVGIAMFVFVVIFIVI